MGRAAVTLLVLCRAAGGRWLVAGGEKVGRELANQLTGVVSTSMAAAAAVRSAAQELSCKADKISGSVSAATASMATTACEFAECAIERNVLSQEGTRVSVTAQGRITVVPLFRSGCNFSPCEEAKTRGGRKDVPRSLCPLWRRERL